MLKKFLPIVIIGAASCTMVLPASASASTGPGEFSSVLVHEFSSKKECLEFLATQSHYTWCRQNEKVDEGPGMTNRLGRWQPR